MTVRSKRYRDIEASIGSEPRSPKAAISLAKTMATAKFDETVELHVKTNADPRQADQQLRTAVALPNGVGKEVKVFVFVEGANIRAAEEAGADYVMNDDYISQIEKGWADFDASVATPDVMPKIAKLGRHLGRKGLMPNPRSGGVVQPQDLESAIKALKRGRVELRLDRTAVIHTSLGLSAFEENQLIENLSSVYAAILQAKPNGVKGDFIRSATLCTTMGPGIKMKLPDLEELAVRADT